MHLGKTGIALVGYMRSTRAAASARHDRYHWGNDLRSGHPLVQFVFATRPDSLAGLLARTHHTRSLTRSSALAEVAVNRSQSADKSTRSSPPGVRSGRRTFEP